MWLVTGGEPVILPTHRPPRWSFLLTALLSICIAHLSKLGECPQHWQRHCWSPWLPHRGRTCKVGWGGWGSLRLELYRFPLFLHEAQWVLKHKHFLDYFVPLVDFQSTKWFYLSVFPALWSHLGERICAIFSQSQSKKFHSVLGFDFSHLCLECTNYIDHPAGYKSSFSLFFFHGAPFTHVSPTYVHSTRAMKSLSHVEDNFGKLYTDRTTNHRNWLTISWKHFSELSKHQLLLILSHVALPLGTEW